MMEIFLIFVAVVFGGACIATLIDAFVELLWRQRK